MKTLHLAIIITAGMVLPVAFGIYVTIHPIFGGTAPSSTIRGYINIDTPGLEKMYKTGQPVNFSVSIQGFGLYPCQPPEIAIYNDAKTKPVFYYTTQSVSCPDSSEHYTFYFPSQNSTFSTMINDTGNYTLDVSLGNDSYQKEFSVISGNNAQQEKQNQMASIKKVVGTGQLKEVLSGKPIDNFTGIIFGAFDWSHDGKFLAFSTNSGNPPSYLWVMSSDGRQTRIIDTPKVDSIYSPRISPDDGSVYYIGGYNKNGTQYQDIYRCGLESDDNSCQDLTGHSKISAFDFTPSGNGLVFVENHSNTTFVRSFTFLVRHYNLLWLSDLDGKKQKLLFNCTQPFSGMSLSPDGRTIVFFDSDNPVHPQDNGTYMKYNFPGGGIPGPKPVYLALFDMSQKNFTILDSSTDYVYGNFGWTSDGKYVISDKLFSHEMVEVKPETYSTAGLVTLVPVSDPKNQTILYGLQTGPYMPTPEGLAVSPDQKSVVFGMDTDYYDGEIQGRGIYQIDFANPLP
ncbi:MAG: hypothetical protein ACREBI_07085 [Nitrosotalea sp.]